MCVCVSLATLRNSDRTKQICLWMTIYIFIMEIPCVVLEWGLKVCSNFNNAITFTFGLNPWERHESPYPSSSGLNSIIVVLLQTWLWD